MCPGGANDDILFKKGSDFVKNKQFDEALEIFDDIILSDTSNEKAWIARGVVLNYQQKYQAAELAFNQALRIDPNNQTAINNRDMVKKHIGPSSKNPPLNIKPCGTEPGTTRLRSDPSPNPKPKRLLKKWEKVAIILVCVVASFIWPNILTQILLPIYFIAIIYIIGWTHDPAPST